MVSELEYTPLDEIPRIRDRLDTGFRSGKLRSIAYRRKKLLSLAHLLQDNESRFISALEQDLGRPAVETLLFDLNASIYQVSYNHDNVEKWAQPEKAEFSLQFAAMRPIIRKEAKGVVCIIGPFNLPLICMFSPAAGAIAAGNAVALKCPEQTPATSALISELVPKYMDTDIFDIINGGVAEATRMLELRWDHIFYTGGSRVGKIVSTAAAKHLTPVTLELGGKNPVFVDSSADISLTARRMMWGKFFNAGQTCLTPDYVLVTEELQDKLIEAFITECEKFYGPGTNSVGNLISTAAFHRIKGYLDRTKGKIVYSGLIDENRKYFHPTIVRDVSLDDALMEEEIFGPILAVVPIKDMNEVIKIINSFDYPLALYVFSRDKRAISHIFDNTNSGACIANDVLIHAAVDGLPFGGIGGSGFGMHKCKFSFDTFTHYRSSIDSPGFIDIFMGARYPPYTEKSLRDMKKLSAVKLPPLDYYDTPSLSSRTAKWIASAALIAAMAFTFTLRKA